MDEEPLAGVEGALVRWVGQLPTALAGAVRVGSFTTARPGAVLRIVPDFASFLARDGAVVEVAPEPGVARDRIMPLIHGPMAAALIHQRGELPLHGATLAHPVLDAAIAIVGPQGAGKSTLAFEMIRRGWRLISDDLTRVTMAPEGAIAWPGRRGIKLCPDACARFALDTAEMSAIGERGKMLADIAPMVGPVPLVAAFALDRSAEHGTARVTGAAALALLSSNSMKMAYVTALGTAAAHLDVAGRLAAAIALVRLGGEDTPASLGARIEAYLNAAALLPSRSEQGN